MSPYFRARLPLAALLLSFYAMAVSAQEMQRVPAFVQNRYVEAAGKGDVKAQFALGLLNERGLTKNASAETAASWYRLASTNGYAPAQYRLALLLERGQVAPVEGETVKALYRSAATKGLKEAQHNLAILLEQQGEDREAFEWYQAAATSGLARSMRALGVIYAQGRGAEKNPVLAWVWLVRAVRAGDGDAVALVSDADGKLTQEQREEAEAYLKNNE